MILRWIVGLPLAALITACLFLVMTYLIKQDFEPTIVDPRSEIIITAKKIDTPLGQQPKLTELPDPPEPVDIPPADPQGLPDPDNIPVDPPIGPGEIPPVDPPTATTPVIPIPPPYPERCLQKGAEGVVVVQFDVTPKGEVVNARIISSPNSCFDRPVLRAVAKWKYAPNITGNQATARTNVVERFRFEIDK